MGNEKEVVTADGEMYGRRITIVIGDGRENRLATYIVYKLPFNNNTHTHTRTGVMNE